jgi:hypothetical protein
VEGSEEEVVAAEEVVAVVAAVAPPEDLLDVHQVVRRVAPDPEVLLHPAVHVVQVCLGVPFHPVMGPPGRRQLSRSLGSLDQTDYPLNPIIPVRVRVPVSWEAPASVGFAGFSFVGTAGGAVAMLGQSLVETIPLTRWSRPWQKERSWEPVAAVSPSESTFVD